MISAFSFSPLAMWLARSMCCLMCRSRFHRYEGGELHEAGIDLAECAVALDRHVVDQVLLEPFDRLAFGEFVDLGRLDAGVDRTGHQGQRRRACGMIVLRHDGRRRQRRDRRLADRHHVRARSHLVEEGDQMLGVILQAEPAVAERNVARVVPVGDVDVVVLQQRLHGAAQQRREMAGHRGHQQQARLLRRIHLLEPQQRAERRRIGDFLDRPRPPGCPPLRCRCHRAGGCRSAWSARSARARLPAARTLCPTSPAAPG